MTDSTDIDASPLRPAPVRTPDAQATKRNIIEIATREFAQNGLSGARVDEIAAKTACSKRMIYYYFGDKEGLYLNVLEEAYRRVRRIEATLDLDHLPPLDAIRALAGFTFDHHHSNDDFIRLVMIENIHHGDYLERSNVIQSLNATAIDTLERLVARGVREGVFRAGLGAIDLHWQISALCFFNVSNRATFSKIFRHDLHSAPAQARLRERVVDTIVRYVVRHPLLDQPQEPHSTPAPG